MSARNPPFECYRIQQRGRGGRRRGGKTKKKICCFFYIAVPVNHRFCRQLVNFAAFLSFFFGAIKPDNCSSGIGCLQSERGSTPNTQEPISSSRFFLAAGFAGLLRRDNTSGQTMEPSFCQSQSQSIKHNWLSATMAAVSTQQL